MPSYHYTTQSPVYSFGHRWTPAVKHLIFINVIIFLLRLVFANTGWFQFLGLQSPDMLSQFRLWQLFTYFFIHFDFWHLAFNMLALWMFGCDVEKRFGTKSFYQYYLLTGVFTGICVAVVGKITGEHSITIGASGAIFAILLAYGVLFANKTITLLLFLIIPVSMKARTMVLIFAIVEFIAGVGPNFGKVSHIAHLSGLIIGYFYFMLVYPDQISRFDLFKAVRHWRLSKRIKVVNPEEQVDEILEKISKSGIDSLSKKERDILSSASKRRRHHRPEDN